MSKQIKYLKCTNCGYEDSSFLTTYHIEGDVILECPKCKTQSQFEEMYCEKGREMSFKEYTELLQYIVENHGWRKGFNKNGSKHIKYVRHSFDTRTNKIFSIQLDYEDFSIVNENRHRNLKDWIYGYLES